MTCKPRTYPIKQSRRNQKRKAYFKQRHIKRQREAGKGD